MKVIIFEGIDCTGKSTASKELVKKLLDANPRVKVMYYHMTGEDPQSVYAMQHFFGRMHKFKVDYLIFDRSMIGEMFYGPKYRGASSITLGETYRILKEFDHEIHFKKIPDDKWIAHKEEYFKREEATFTEYEEIRKDYLEFYKVVRSVKKTGLNVIFSEFK